MNNKDGFEDILISHMRNWPFAQLQDLIKLLYQQVFGSGHLISDADASLKRIQKEVDNLTLADDKKPPLIEPIGDGLCRLHLAGLAASGLGIATLNRMVVHSASSQRGTRDLFKEKLAHLMLMLDNGRLPFDKSELAQWINQYDFEACLPIRHSLAFNEHDQPAYRLLHQEFGDFLRVFAEIDQLLKKQNRLLVGIDGRCGSGKSTLANLLAVVFDCSLVRMDHFFLPLDLRTPERLAEIGGNVDYDRFAATIAPWLHTGHEFAYRPFDCQTMAFDQPITINPSRLLVVEGSYSMHPRLNAQYDLSIFLSVPATEQLRRLRQRNTPEMVDRFISTWIPMEEQYFEKWQIPAKCDLVLDLQAEE